MVNVVVIGERRKMKIYKFDKLIKEAIEGQITLYRGIEKEFSDSFDLSRTDAPNGYSTWTTNPKLARQYAGENGFVYQIELPLSNMGEGLIDADGERVLFFNNGKKAGLNGVSGDEYLVYHDHENYFPSLMKLTNY